MNDTKLNAELFAGDSRGRKHIPMAVFAVILIHVVLFLVLLVAAGCRAKARARQNMLPTQVAAAQEASSESAALSAATTNLNNEPISLGRTEPVLATEPVIEPERVTAPGPERTARRASPSRPRAEALRAAGPAIYVVRPGDTVGKIAKDHGMTIRALRSENRLKSDLIFPGQKLRVSAPRQMASI